MGVYMDGTGLTMHPCKEVVKLETFNCDKSLQKTRNAKSGENLEILASTIHGIRCHGRWHHLCGS
jgi:hypothetical protein